MNVIPFVECVSSEYLMVLASINAHFDRKYKRYIIDKLRWSADIAICEGVHICDPLLLIALSTLYKERKDVDLYVADEENFTFKKL